MSRLFLDANVLFTAALSSGGRSSLLLDLAGVGRCELVTSPHALAEARRNIELKRPEALERLERGVLVHLTIVPEAKIAAVEIGLERGLPLKDAPILGAALQAGVDMLVTGDARHFGHLYGERINDMEVATPAVALAGLLRE